MTAWPDPDPRYWRPLVWGSLAAGVALLAVFVVQGRALGVIVAAAALVASVTGLRVLRLPRPVLAALPPAAVLNAASIGWDWYTAWDPFDLWAHFLNPVFLVVPSMVWLHRADIIPERPGSPLALGAAVVYGLVIAVAWEVIETFFWAYPLSDTASDVGLGVLGALAGGWLAGRILEPGR